MPQEKPGDFDPQSYWEARLVESPGLDGVDLFDIVDDMRLETATRNISSMLRPGGHFVFSDSFLPQDTVRARHQVNRSLIQTTRTLTSVGFQIESRAPMFVLMSFTIDPSQRIFQFLWRATTAVVKKAHPLGFVMGSTLYPLEILLTAFLKESPSTEMMICKKDAWASC